MNPRRHRLGFRIVFFHMLCNRFNLCLAPLPTFRREVCPTDDIMELLSPVSLIFGAHDGPKVSLVAIVDGADSLGEGGVSKDGFRSQNLADVMNAIVSRPAVRVNHKKVGRIRIQEPPNQSTDYHHPPPRQSTMSSALAQQLRAIASLDADRLASHHGAPVGKSYLFPPKVASSHDNNAIYNIAISGLEELVEVEPEMLEFEEELFSDASRTTDRMMLTAEENKRLNVVLDRCILKLGKWITLKATSKCLEWLVRRFR